MEDLLIGEVVKVERKNELPLGDLILTYKDGRKVSVFVAGYDGELEIEEIKE